MNKTTLYLIFLTVFIFSTSHGQNLEVLGDGYISGKLGIGVSTPNAKLQVGDSNGSPGDVFITVGSAGGNSSVSGLKLIHFSDAFGFTIESDDKVPMQGLNIRRHVNDNQGVSSMFIDLSGNIGIGTMVPSEKLDIDGAVVIKNSAYGTPFAGTIRFNPATNDFEGYNGIFWTSLTGFQFELGQMTDVDGNTYPTVIIGTQEWMAKNLRTTKYDNGDDITLIGNDPAGDAAWSTANYGAYCIYDTIGSGYQAYEVNEFGYLYNWYAVNDSRNVCPVGWHEPTDSDFSTLTTFLGGITEGGAMKEAGPVFWYDPNFGATNTSGYTGLPGGARLADGSFSSIGFSGYWWTSTDYDINNAWYRGLEHSNSSFDVNNDDKKSGISVRCVKD